eukprot:RCo033856
MGKRDCIDWMHGNTLFWDIEHDAIYYNSRSLDTFYKINKRTKAVEWSVGRMGTLQMFDVKGQPSPSLFYHAHSVDKQDEHTFMIFDNNYNNRHAMHGGSRVSNLHFRSGLVEVTVWPERGTANISWQWYAPRNYSAVYNGDADLLPNGNVLGTFPQATTLTEVSRSGEVVWELRLPPDRLTPYR